LNPTKLFVVLVVPVVVVAVGGTIPLPAGSVQILVPLEVSYFDFVAMQQVHELKHSLGERQTFHYHLSTLQGYKYPANLVVAVDGTVPVNFVSTQISVLSLASLGFVAGQQAHDLPPPQALALRQTFQFDLSSVLVVTAVVAAGYNF